MQDAEPVVEGEEREQRRESAELRLAPVRPDRAHGVGRHPGLGLRSHLVEQDLEAVEVDAPIREEGPLAALYESFLQPKLIEHAVLAVAERRGELSLVEVPGIRAKPAE